MHIVDTKEEARNFQFVAQGGVFKTGGVFYIKAFDPATKNEFGVSLERGVIETIEPFASCIICPNASLVVD